MSFVHLHAHSDASDGVGTVDRLVAAAVADGQRALALTDHGTMTNAVSFFLACVDGGIKPIFGQEVYLALPARKEGEEARVHHMTVLAKDAKGLSNLYKLTTLGAKSPFRKPAIMLEQLISHNEGLILLSGCSASPIYHLEGAELNSFVRQLKGAFDSRFWFEITLVPGVDTATRIMALSHEHGIPVVVTSDVHYADRASAQVHSLMTGIRFGYRYESAGLWLKTTDQVTQAMKALDIYSPDILHASGKIAEEVEFIDIRSAPSLPHVDGAHEFIRSKVVEELKAIRGLVSADELRSRVARASMEMKVISDMGYLDYFFIVHDLVSWARDHGIGVGPGRGSAAGSYLLYLLGVTQVDPITFDLSFERFLNPRRKDMPDVDIDFSMAGRDRVLTYANERWGGVPIATYAHYSHKTLVHDLSKGLAIPKDVEERAAEDQEGEDFNNLMTGNHLFASTYNLALGQIRHRGKHASGIVITSQEVPLERAGDTLVVPWTEGDQKELSKVGVVKFDLLGLSAVTALERMHDLSGVTPGRPFGADDETLNLFRQGNLLGIFQFTGSRGIRSLTMKVAPTSGEDLTAINALYRPGALDVGSANAFPEWKKKPRKLHPRIDPFLERTFGAIVYQEQVMAVVAEVMGGDLGDADLARRLIVKSKVGDADWEAAINRLHMDFLDKGVSREFEHGFLVKLWIELISHARYSFNRAHAACYAHISYDMAYFKAHAPHAFYAAMLAYDQDNEASYIYEATMRGTRILPPHVNESTTTYELVGKTIRLPLGMVKFLGDNGAAKVLKARTIGGPFTSFEDFNARVEKRAVNSRARFSLWAAGAFNGIAGDPRQCGIHTEELTVPVGSREAQRSALGFTLPTAAMIKKIEEVNGSGSKGLVAGVISAIVEKKKAHGMIWSVYLYPDGFVWFPEKPDFVKGDAIVVETKGVKAMKAKFI